MYTKTTYVNGTSPAINSTNLNNNEDGTFLNTNLYAENIKDTTATASYTGDDITQLEHKDVGDNTKRTDNFTYTDTLITEVRTLDTLETVTYDHYFDSSGNFIRTEVT